MPTFFGALGPAMRDCTHGTPRRPIYVPGLMRWTPHLRSWPHLRRQHDVAEFWGYLIALAEPNHMAGTWESRTDETPFFTIQLKRYHYRLGHPHKRTDPILLRPGAVVHVPIFCAGASLEVRTVPCRLIFAIVHTGPTTEAGHYQAALSCGQRFFLSDDGAASRPMKASEYEWVNGNCYLIGLSRCT